MDMYQMRLFATEEKLIRESGGNDKLYTLLCEAAIKRPERWEWVRERAKRARDVHDAFVRELDERLI
jgi:hypothetical protein